MPTPIIPNRVAERARDRVTVDPVTGCHISQYSVSGNGYPQIGWQDQLQRYMVNTHRASWVATHGQIPEGMTIDHICKNKLCGNVDHLRMLTNFENARRTDGRDWPVGECINGHPNSELVALSGGKKACRICRAAAQARYEAHRRPRSA